MVNVVKVKTFSLDSVMGSCVVAQWGIRRPQVAVKASFYPTRLESHLDNNVGDAGVSSVAKACASSLKTLKLLDCYKVGDESISSLAQILREIVRDGDDETCVVSWMGSSSRIDKATFFGVKKQ
ncbi:hypothetical protein YC2023_077163 [Brassica napus]